MVEDHPNDIPGPLVVPGSLSAAPDGPALVGGACGACSNTFFPATEFCPQCLSTAVCETNLPRRGTLEAYTVVEAGAQPGFETPFPCGFVTLEGSIRLFAPLSGVDDVDDCETGAPVELVVEAVRTDPETGETGYGHAFEPVEGDA